MSPRNFKQRPKPGWIIILAVVLAVAGFATVRAGRDVMKLGRLWGMKRQEQRQLDDAISRRDELNTLVERLLGDMSYIEEIARRDYGMKRPGEQVFIVLPDSSKR